MAKQQKLGRGLDALLSKNNIEQVQQGDILDNIDINKLQRGKFQPRSEINDNTLTELAESIKSQGVIQPIVVRPIGDKYEIIAGERRFRASGVAGLKQIPAIIRPMNDEVALAIGLIENIQRESLTPLEEANALVRLIEDFNMTHAKVSEVVGRSRSAVSNIIRLLQLDDSVKQLLNNGDIEMGHARTLLALEPQYQLDIAKQVIEKQLSVRQTENLVKQMLNPPKPKAQTPDYIIDLENNLSTKLNNKVVIKYKDNKGKISINFQSEEELKNLINKLQ